MTVELHIICVELRDSASEYSHYLCEFVDVSFKEIWKENPHNIPNNNIADTDTILHLDVSDMDLDLSKNYLWLAIGRYDTNDDYNVYGEWEVLYCANSKEEAKKNANNILVEEDLDQTIEFHKLYFSKHDIPYKEWALKNLLT